MTFFTLCWDVQGNGWSSRYETLVKFIALRFQLNWSGFLFSFNSDTLKSTYSSCLFVLWSEPPLLIIPCGTWCVSGSVVSGFACVSKLGGFCAILLGIWGGFDINVKIDLVWTLIMLTVWFSTSFIVCLGSSAPCLCNLVFLSGDICACFTLYFIFIIPKLACFVFLAQTFN